MGGRGDLLVQEVYGLELGSIPLEGARLCRKFCLRFVRNLRSYHVTKNGYEKTPIIFVQVPQLPKDALVEWQFAVHTGRRVTPVLNDDEELEVVGQYQSCK